RAEGAYTEVSDGSAPGLTAAHRGRGRDVDPPAGAGDRPLVDLRRRVNGVSQPTRHRADPVPPDGRARRGVHPHLARRRADDVASSYEVDASGKVWTFTIRSDANWQDAAAVTADDVLYTVRLLQEKAYHGPFADAFRGVAVTALAPKIVRFSLPDAYAPFAGSTTVPLLPSHLLSQVTFGELARQPFNTRPVGTGPFKVSELDTRQVTHVRSDDFYRTKPARSRPYLDKIVLRFYRDEGEALAALARGEVDGTGGLSPQDASRARTLK